MRTSPLSESFTATTELIRQFGDLVSDHNPIHLNASSASNASPIVHGSFVLSYVIGMVPRIFFDHDEYEVLLAKLNNVRFLQPITAGETITITLAVKDLIREDASGQTLQLSFSAKPHQGGNSYAKGKIVAYLRRKVQEDI